MDEATAKVVTEGVERVSRRFACDDQLKERLAEARATMDRFVKSEANAEMMTVVIRTLETLVDGVPTTPMRKHHHE